MIFDKNIAKKTAELLLHINAIKLNPRKPFTWASGWKSPIYCDNRLVLSYPAIRNFIKQSLEMLKSEKIFFPEILPKKILEKYKLVDITGERRD